MDQNNHRRIFTGRTGLDVGLLPFWLRAVLVALLVLLVMSLMGCGSSMPVERVKRYPPAAPMVPPEPLHLQLDPSLGGVFKGYVRAAQEYRSCADRLTELQEYVKAVECKY